MRKNLGRILFAIAVTAALVAGTREAVGQERVITEAEFMVFFNRGFEVFRNTPYREKRTIETREVGGTDWRPHSIDEYEYIKPDRMRWLSTTTGVGETEPSTEQIHIGEKRYIRWRGQWHVEKEPKRMLPPRVASNTAKPAVEFKHLGSTTVFNQPATLIQKTVIRKDMIDGKEVLVTNTQQNWFDAAGRFLKQEFLTHKPPSRSMRQVIVYEYDPNIKIEAPIK